MEEREGIEVCGGADAGRRRLGRANRGYMSGDSCDVWVGVIGMREREREVNVLTGRRRDFFLRGERLWRMLWLLDLDLASWYMESESARKGYTVLKVEASWCVSLVVK